jgi:hypothetical protein
VNAEVAGIALLFIGAFVPWVFLLLVRTAGGDDVRPVAWLFAGSGLVGTPIVALALLLLGATTWWAALILTILAEAGVLLGMTGVGRTEEPRGLA